MSEIQVSALSIGPDVDKVIAEEFYGGMAELPNTAFARQTTAFEPPAAGFSEIANIISFLADSKEVLLPIATAMAGKYGGTAAGSFRNMLSRCRRNPKTGRPYVPMMISFGTNLNFPSVRFYFHREVDADELGRQLQEMVKVLESIPEAAFDLSPGPMEFGFFWDHNDLRWRENFANRSMRPSENSDPWFPEKIFDDWIV
jgi:hypothetical protein